MDQWVYENKAKLCFITSGRPIEKTTSNRSMESCVRNALNQHLFLDLEDARETIEEWRLDYNQQRSHIFLGQRTPQRFRNIAVGYAGCGRKTTLPTSGIATTKAAG